MYVRVVQRAEQGWREWKEMNQKKVEKGVIGARGSSGKREAVIGKSGVKGRVIRLVPPPLTSSFFRLFSFRRRIKCSLGRDLSHSVHARISSEGVCEGEVSYLPREAIGCRIERSVAGVVGMQQVVRFSKPIEIDGFPIPWQTPSLPYSIPHRPLSLDARVGGIVGVLHPHGAATQYTQSFYRYCALSHPLSVGPDGIEREATFITAFSPCHGAFRPPPPSSPLTSPWHSLHTIEHFPISTPFATQLTLHICTHTLLSFYPLTPLFHAFLLLSPHSPAFHKLVFLSCTWCKFIPYPLFTGRIIIDVSLILHRSRVNLTYVHTRVCFRGAI